MQHAVERDSKGQSNYAMCAVNPSRISKTFSDAALREVIDTIAVCTGSLLEIVNYNVEVYIPIILLVRHLMQLRYRDNNMFALASSSLYRQ